MPWNVSGQALELCNCAVLCGCWLGPAKPDQGWCGGTFVFDIQRGTADGVDLAGKKVALSAEWPGDFWSGKGKARLYIDESATAAQRRELEAIFSGKKGGLFEPLLGGIISMWLPARVTKIAVEHGESPSATVGDVGHVSMRPLKDGTGKPTRIEGAAAQAAFQIDRMHVASSKGSRWSDPELRAWEGDSGNLIAFDWKS
ncbi:MAG: DUF1326 domain-containing protein [Candidatus Rokubacteria bacterium]|nr:DUF1326 domain-containing protein [Candidatus Rokubacteria bacterium]